MWLNFLSIEEHHDLVSRAGNTYSGFVIRGTRKAFGEDHEQDWEKIVFDSQAATVIEKGVVRPNCSIVQFFQKAVRPGDRVNIKFKRDGKFNNAIDTLEVMENRRNVPTYEPLSDDDAELERGSSPSERYQDDIPPYLKKDARF